MGQTDEESTDGSASPEVDQRTVGETSDIDQQPETITDGSQLTELLGDGTHQMGNSFADCRSRTRPERRLSLMGKTEYGTWMVQLLLSPTPGMMDRRGNILSKSTITKRRPIPHHRSSSKDHHMCKILHSARFSSLRVFNPSTCWEGDQPRQATMTVVTKMNC
jgi:hypothetical protein